MFGFIKKLFGFGGCQSDGSCCNAEAPYKVEAAVQAVKTAADVNKDGKVNLDDAKAVVNKAATQVAKGAQQVAKKTAPKKPAGVKLRQPGAPKQGQKKPAQPKTQGAKPAGNKPRGRKPKAKPAAQ